MKWFHSLRIRHMVIILFCIGFVLHAFSLTNSFLWDDEQFVQKNTYVQNIALWPNYFTTNTIAGAGFVSGYYRPLTTLSFALDAYFFGINPFPFHLVNTLMHATAGVLLFLVLLSLFSYMGLKRQRVFSFILSVIFLIHPTQVEAVANISSRGDSLHTIFGLASLYFFLNLNRLKKENTVIVYASLSIIFAICSVLSKEIGIIWTGIPILLFTVHAVIKKQYPKAQGYTGLTLLLIGGIYTLLHMTVLNFQKSQDLGWPELYTNSALVRVATFLFHAVPEYLHILFIPTNLHMERTLPIVSSLKDIMPTSFIILVIALFAMILSLVHMYKNDRSLFHVQIVGLLWFFASLLPVSGIIPSNGLIYEHWLYIPMIGFWMYALTIPLYAYQQNKKTRKPLFVVFIMICIVWFVLSVIAILRYKSPFTFYPYTLQFEKTVRLYNNLGMAYAERGEFEKAEQIYMEALQVYPGYPQVFHNLGNLYFAQGKYDDAYINFKKALDIDSSFFFSINKLIEMFAKKGELEKVKYWAEYGNKTFKDSTTYYMDILTSLSKASTGSVSGQLSSP